MRISQEKPKYRATIEKSLNVRYSYIQKTQNSLKKKKIQKIYKKKKL